MDFDEELRREQEVKRLLIEDCAMDYWIGNPVVQIIQGQLNLDGKQQQQDLQTSLSSSTPIVSFSSSLEDLVAYRRYRIKTDHPDFPFTSLVLFGIQNSKSPVEVCEYLKESTSNESGAITEIRVFRTSSNLMYGMLIYFLNNSSCREYFEKHFGERFNSIEPDICILRPLQSVTFNLDSFDVKVEEETILSTMNSSSSLSVKSGELKEEPVTISEVVAEKPSISEVIGGTKQLAIECEIPCEKEEVLTKIKVEHSSEVLSPSVLSLVYNTRGSDVTQCSMNCAICQESLTHAEESTGSARSSSSPASILSIMCGHYFHSNCLSQWQDSICPLCRYQQQPPKLSYCEVCQGSEVLWICLVCGSINCGLEFSDSSHVKMHFASTKHTYAMEVESKFVYDYSKDCFVHRLMQNISDGKIVDSELATEGSQDSRNSQEEMSKGKSKKGGKNDDVLQEYEMQMSSSLDGQRKYFQAKMSEINRNHSRRMQELETERKKINESIEEENRLIAEQEEQLRQEEKAFEVIKQEFFELNTRKNALSHEEAALSVKYQQLESQDQKYQDSARKQIIELQEEFASKLQEIKDAEGHLKAKKQIEQSGEDMSQSVILMLGGVKEKKKTHGRKQ